VLFVIDDVTGAAQDLALVRDDHFPRIGKVAGGTGDEPEAADDSLFVVELLPAFGREPVEPRVVVAGRFRVVIEYLLRRSGMENRRPENRPSTAANRFIAPLLRQIIRSYFLADIYGRHACKAMRPLESHPAGEDIFPHYPVAGKTVKRILERKCNLPCHSLRPFLQFPAPFASTLLTPAIGRP
jgi:hypothetical protein